MEMDLGSLKSIKQFVNEFKKREQNLHILVNNAGKNSDFYKATIWPLN